MHFLNFVVLSWRVRSIFLYTVFTRETNQIYMLTLSHRASYLGFYGQLETVGHFYIDYTHVASPSLLTQTEISSVAHKLA